MRQTLSYKGKGVVIEYRDADHAEVTIEGRPFSFTRHAAALPMWFCDEAYFMSDDLIKVIRHMIDYWYVITRPNRAPRVPVHHGDVPVPPGGTLSSVPTVGRRTAPADGEHGGGHAGGGGGHDEHGG